MGKHKKDKDQSSSMPSLGGQPQKKKGSKYEQRDRDKDIQREKERERKGLTEIKKIKVALNGDPMGLGGTAGAHSVLQAARKGADSDIAAMKMR